MRWASAWHYTCVDWSNADCRVRDPQVAMGGVPRRAGELAHVYCRSAFQAESQNPHSSVRRFATHLGMRSQPRQGERFLAHGGQPLSLPTFSGAGGWAMLIWWLRFRDEPSDRALVRWSQVKDDVMTCEAVLAPDAWAEVQFGEVVLGDLRRTRRAVRAAEQMARHPAASIPEQAGHWSGTRASYRLFSEEFSGENLAIRHTQVGE